MDFPLDADDPDDSLKDSDDSDKLRLLLVELELIREGGFLSSEKELDLGFGIIYSNFLSR